MLIPVKVPAVGESVTEAVMGRWFKQDGERVEADAPIGEIESEKATLELTAEKAGVLHIRARTGETLAIGALIAEIDPEGVAGVPDGKMSAAVEVLPGQEVSAGAGHARATPMAKRLMAEAGLATTAIRGSGVSGRVTRQDVLSRMAEGRTALSTPVIPLPAEPAVEPGADSARPSVAPGAAAARPARRERMSTLRQTIARRLVASKNETAMLTTINEIDMSAILKVRAEQQEAFTRKFGIKLGFMSFFAHAICTGLREFPVINARVEGNEIVYPDYCDLCIAVSTPRGLVTPVVRNAEALPPAGLEMEIQRLAQKARDGKLAVDEMTGGTFTITNGGVFGSLISTPIINPPQSAVLGMHTIQERPVAREGQVVIRPMMYVSLSYDHRIIDGRESVLFLIRVKELLEKVGAELLGL